MLDPRISLAAQAPNLQSSIQLFDSLRNSQLNRQAAQQGIDQSAALFPLQQQQTQQRIDLNAQSLASGEAQQREQEQNRIIRSVSEFSPVLKPLLQESLQSGDTSKAETALTNRLTSLINQGLPTDETVEAIAQLRSGNTQAVLDNLNTIDNAAVSRGLVQEKGRRVLSSKILADGTTVQSLAGGGTNVISSSGDILQGQERIDAISGALGTTVEQKKKGAQAVSDVKIGETKALEKESEVIKQEIEQNKINIDETKFTSQEKRKQAIDQKNARRKEADSAIDSIDDLLKGNRFSSAFGKVVTKTPELLRSQKSIDAIADVDQIRGLITLESRQKLKGQGTITDSEQKILAQSATVLNDPLISDERARKELRKIRRVFEDASDRNQLKRETRDAPTETSDEFAGFKVVR